MKLLTQQQAAQTLGVSIGTLWKMDKLNPIPSYRVGSRRKFEEKELLKWFEEQRTEG